MSSLKPATLMLIGAVCAAAVVGVVVRARIDGGTTRAPSLSIGSSAGPGAGSNARRTIDPKEARASAIRATIEAINAECARNAGGDWRSWCEKLEPVRSELREKIALAKALHPNGTGSFEASAPVLEGRDHFCLFESAPAHYLGHVVDASVLEAFRKEQPVAAATRWLEEQGIDVIFVPVPKMTEVYPEFFTEYCPSDRIIAPHVRQAMLELLEADVEVVDLWYPFQEAREREPEPLYQPADPHWGPRAQAIAARLVAERMKRYEFVVKARAAAPICETVTASYPAARTGAAFGALNPEQQRLAEAHQPRFYRAGTNCTRSLYDDAAPVACIGDSYNAGFIEQLAIELNLPVRSLSGGGTTTQQIKDFVREPALIKDCKVVVWVVCNTALQSPWPLPRKVWGSVGRK